jgi:hypothetical protein
MKSLEGLSYWKYGMKEIRLFFRISHYEVLDQLGAQ